MRAGRSVLRAAVVAMAAASCAPARSPAPVSAPMPAPASTPAPPPTPEPAPAPLSLRAWLDALPGRERWAAAIDADEARPSPAPPPTARRAEIAPASSFTYERVESGPFTRIHRVPRAAKAEPLAHEVPVRSAKPGKRRAPPAAPPSPVTDRGKARAELPLPRLALVSAVEPVGDDLRIRIETPLAAPRWVRYVAKDHRIVEEGSVDAGDVGASWRGSCRIGDARVDTVVSQGARAAGPTIVLGRGPGLDLPPALRLVAREWLANGGTVVEVHGVEAIHAERLAACGGTRAVAAVGAGAVLAVVRDGAWSRLDESTVRDAAVDLGVYLTSAATAEGPRADR